MRDAASWHGGRRKQGAAPDHAKKKIDEAVANDKSIVTADATPLVEAVEDNTQKTERVADVVEDHTTEAVVAASAAAMAAADAKEKAAETRELIEVRTRPRSVFQRLAGLGLVLLLIYFVMASFTASRQAQDAIEDNKATLDRVAEANDRLTRTNDQLADQIEVIGRQRDALIDVARKQAEQIRELGGDPVDIFDPANTGGVDVGRSTGSGDDGMGGERGVQPSRSGDDQRRPSQNGSQAQPRPSPRPSPQPQPQPSPSPSERPVAEVCALGTCIKIPPVPAPQVPTLPQAGEASVIVPTALMSSEESTAPEGDSILDIDWFSADPNNVARGLGLLVPLLVGLITKKYADRRTKAITNLVASALVGSAAYLVAADGGYDVAGFFNATTNALIASFAAYYGVLKPTGVAAKVQDKTAGVGIGSGQPPVQTDAPTYEKKEQAAEQGLSLEEAEAADDEEPAPEAETTVLQVEDEWEDEADLDEMVASIQAERPLEDIREFSQRPIGPVECRCVTNHNPNPTGLERHHIIPQAQGGPDDPENLIWLCGTAHNNVHTLLRLLEKGNGDIPWEAERKFNKHIRDLARKAYEAGYADR